MTAASRPDVASTEVATSEGQGFRRRVPLSLITATAALGFAVILGAPQESSAKVLMWIAMAIMLVAAAEDLKTRRLRNSLVAPALVFALAADPSWATGAAALVAVFPFLVFAFWKPGSIGMGDVKFAAPAGALAGFEEIGALLIVIALLGGVLSIVAFARFGRSGTLAYGPAIALGTLWVAFLAS
jgi:leader peptidase (prepilin peptidase)/N-methyltransferase